MIKKLYRKLYLYAIFIILTSIILTTTFISIIFQSQESNFFSSRILREAQFVQRFLKQTEEYKPEQLNKKIKELAKDLGWRIYYWKDGKLVYSTNKKSESVSQENLNELKRTGNIVVVKELRPHPEYLLYLNPSNPDRGYLLIIKYFGNPDRDKTGPRIISPPITGILLILLFLGLLMIPYTLYVIRPFKRIMASINKVSKGDFSANIELAKNSEFKELADAFNNMTFKVQEMIEQKQRLIADVSHELRSPLTRMRLGLEILSKDPEGRKRYIDKSIVEIENLDKMIEDILLSSKLELDEKNFILNKSDIKKIIIENIEKHQLLFEKHKLKINTDFPEETIMLKLEKHLIERALNNIFSNTVKYAPEGSVVDVSLKISGKTALLTIRDRGTGVEHSEQERIFEPFYRTDDSRTRKTGGTGLGLSIVKKIIESHNGTIVAKSADNGESGLVILIELPLSE